MMASLLSRLPAALSSRRVRYTASLLGRRDPGDILILAFSKDRPLQLDLLLRTLREQVSPRPTIHVLYRASSEAFQAAYETVFSENSGLELIAHSEKAFRNDMLRICRNSRCGSVMFLVDDIVFLRPVDLMEVAELARRGHIVSLRLGLNITRAQTENGAVKKVPSLAPVQGTSSSLLAWRWSKAEPGPWSLPTALDGNVLPLPELIPVLEATAFKAPNSLEAAICQYRFLFKYSRGVCYGLPRIVNLPLNSVKSEDFDFPHMGMSVESMLALYVDGVRLDVSDFPHVRHDGCHVEWMPKMTRRQVEKQP